MAGTTREAFLEKVRQSVGAQHAEPCAPQAQGDVPDATDVGRMTDDRPLPNVFAERATEAGMNVERVADVDEAARAIERILRDEEVGEVAMWAGPPTDALTLDDCVTVCHWDPGRPAADVKSSAFGMLCGITGVDYAVAETGSLVLCSSPDHGRSVSLLGRVHIALVFENQILPDLYDLFPRVREDHPDLLPANVTLITGPSKTADIELSLVIGVHGPSVVYIVVVES